MRYRGQQAPEQGAGKRDVENQGSHVYHSTMRMVRILFEWFMFVNRKHSHLWNWCSAEDVARSHAAITGGAGDIPTRDTIIGAADDIKKATVRSVA
jgi:hypothetical protein